ncbi:MAG: MerR family transcriptional regulator [Ktedonobacteraceae bacterium]
MYEQHLQFKQYLQRQEVQERIRERIRRNRSQITAPIGGAISLFSSFFSENQLRKWEEKGLLNPQREGKHRHYSLQDLDKLAVIYELMKEANYSPGAIPSDIDSIWRSIEQADDQQNGAQPQKQPLDINPDENVPINQHIERTRNELFWRYYVSHVIRLSLLLIREHIPGVEQTALGLVLPLHQHSIPVNIIDELPTIGEALIGWLAKSGSSHTLLATIPSFEYSTQFRLYPLRVMENGIPDEADTPTDNTLLLVDWQVNLGLSRTLVKTIRHLLSSLYEDVQLAQNCFGPGMRDVLIPATDIGKNYADYILDGLAEMVIRLGMLGERKKWHFCCILLPNDLTLPLQQRNLIVRAQSTDSPHTVGKTTTSPHETTVGISIRAYQSGQIIYRSSVCDEDLTIDLRKLENPGSAIAIPAGGENSIPSAVLYVASNEPHAFDEDDQRVLRLIGKIVDELLITYRIQQQAGENLTRLITNPEVIDTFFEKRKILSENDFVKDIETLLKDIQRRVVETHGRVDEEIGAHANVDASLGNALTLISLDIDNQAQLANRYGDQFARNLSKVVGSYLQSELLRIFTEAVEYQLYHIGAGRFYLNAKNLSLEDARKNAERLRRKLKDDYEVSILKPMDEETRGNDKQVVSITVRVGVSFYTHKKLIDLIQRYSSATAVGNVRSLINHDIDKALDKGRIEGGDTVISWYPEKRGLVRWSPNAAD